MYSSGYSQVSKHGPGALKRTQYRSKGKSCGYYMRIVFFFSSLIQSLIIVSLVLFLVYGKTQDSASTERIHDLEESFSRLSIENVALRQQRKNLTNLLNTTLTLKARNDWDLERFRHYTNISTFIIQDFERKLQQCKQDFFMCNASPRFPCDCSTRQSDNCNCGLLVERLKARLELVESNFTQTIQRMRIEVEQTAKERDYINLEAIRLRREISIQEKDLQIHKEKCKGDFFQSLSGVSNVSKAFLMKIESLFPTHLAFQLTCTKQRDYLEQIQTNCTSLSREVEDKLQRYLNSVGKELLDTQAKNSRLQAENLRLSSDYRVCIQNRTGLIKEHREKLDRLQQKHDQEKERLLMDKMRLNGEMDVLVNNVKFKIKEVDHLTQQINHLNMSCMSKPGFATGSNYRTGTLSQPSWGGYGGGGSSSANGAQLSRTGSGGLGSSLGSSGSIFNKQGSTGTGSSSSSFLSPGSSSSLGSSGSIFNKQGSTGTGSSSSSFLSPGSSSSLGSSGSIFNKQGSTGTGSASSSFLSPGSSSSLGSSGSLFNKPGSTGTGSSSSSFLSPGSSSSLGSSGSIFNKLGSTGTGSSSSSGSSSSLGSTGSGLNRFGSSGKSSSLSSSGPSSSLGSSGSLFNKQGSTGTGSSSSSHSSSGSSSSLGSSGSLFNKQGSTGTGSSSSSHSSSGSSSSLGSSGSLFNKPGSTGTGSSSSSHSSFGSSSSLGSTGSGLNKPGSTGGASSNLGSAGSSSSLSISGIGSNKQTSSVRSSSGLGASSGSTGSSSSLGSSGIGSNKPTSSVRSSSGVGSSSGSTGSTSKTAPNAFSWFGFGNNNAGQSKTGSETGKGPTSGNSNGGTGSALGAGRSSGLGGGSVNVAQHLQDLQRLINPSGQEEKQDLSRMLG
ncbi:unnamed protein product [Pleuronectes platessa]|uniref:Uncharacterized protein n=1 Tax=Pleuronectes platessa TaxID=8262 RepID=A0A9N7URL7_PLEPL|nr:unnamed protein product [Pleuronectes platessa]